MENFIEILKVIFLGIVEGITEWLPISSTGHLILVEEFVKLDVSQEFWDMFMVVIQLGAIMAVVVLYWKDLWPFRNKKPKHENVTKVEKAAGLLCRFVKIDKMIMWFKILVSCLPAIVIGLPFNDFIEEKFNNWFVVSVMLIVYGVMFLIVEDYNEKRQAKYNSISEITWKTALFIGIFQVLSLIPGTSRSGSTIIGGILVGASRTVAAEYTFFLAIPVMFGASLLKIVKFGLNFTSWEVVILVTGMLVSFIVSILAIKFLMGYIKKHNFKVFGWYRIALGIVVILFFTIFR
ncbi:MAG TPA: undecaprenyl-diphosphate phosphatase [Candidatus Blautia pullistercoris]|uniref:Undecaprenyl-diphosphatase n=1 Tax=Candidatus Blautia pullistercoris TaxID=2838499 RepID=A0A9D2ALX5_9FIRM|nr:undecaprenyl-diphosphate phosphatase [Clostridiales bacterium]HIX36951.1 undecaprenyl-diphosphate phosphatase [Candidatus Blautia pullistercoris]